MEAFFGEEADCDAAAGGICLVLWWCAIFWWLSAWLDSWWRLAGFYPPRPWTQHPKGCWALGNPFAYSRIKFDEGMDIVVEAGVPRHDFGGVPDGTTKVNSADITLTDRQEPSLHQILLHHPFTCPFTG